MKVKSPLFLTLLIVASCLGAQLFAGAWTRPCGEWFFALESYYLHTAKMWDEDGHKLPADNKYQKTEVSLYAEYGLTRCNTLVAQIRYADVDDNFGSEDGIDEAYIGWKHKWFECCDHVISTQTVLIIPGGDTVEAPCWRYGKWGMQSDLLYSTGFDWFCGRGFFDASVGYLSYWGFPGDQIVALTRLGLDLPYCFQVVTWFQLDYGLFNGTDHVATPAVFGNANYRLLKGNLALRYKVTGCVDILAGWQEHLWGEQVGTGGGPYGAVWLKF